MPDQSRVRGRRSSPPAFAQRRVVIEHVWPEIDGGRFPIKRTLGETVTVDADVFADGHDEVAVTLLHRHAGETEWTAVDMEPLGNDRWRASFGVDQLGQYLYTVSGWPDAFGTWAHDLAKRVEAGQDVAVDLRIGASLVDAAADRAEEDDAARLRTMAEQLRHGDESSIELALSDELRDLVSSYPDLEHATTYDQELVVSVDPLRAQFSAWYELFPRSTASEPGRHGTLKDVEARLAYVQRLGFDVLYLPPIHPIGLTHRKGKNNNVVAGPGDPGSPWGIGSAEGGHMAVHPELGTLDDLRSLLAAARARGIDIALDMAFQCSPDHPYVREHPSWFRARPDGTIQYAENPPKKYQDIYPFDFDSEDWWGLWQELRNVVLFWAELGVRIFRVDNPHTKPFAFWEWLIREVKRAHPETIFLSEAFTRPKVMYRLAKLGFTQSYTYFAWRNTALDLTEYLTELTTTEVAEFFRPNFWPNTPDILTETLQTGDRATYAARFVLAATLSSSYGIYGPAYELLEHSPLEIGREEYLNSEKYEIRRWNLDDPKSLAPLIARVNAIRRAHPPLQTNRSLRFHEIDNPELLVYSKSAPGSDPLLVVVNLDPKYKQAGWTSLHLESLGLDTTDPFTATDLLTGNAYTWQGPRNYVELDPTAQPAHIFILQRAAARVSASPVLESQR